VSGGDTDAIPARAGDRRLAEAASDESSAKIRHQETGEMICLNVVEWRPGPAAGSWRPRCAARENRSRKQQWSTIMFDSPGAGIFAFLILSVVVTVILFAAGAIIFQRKWLTGNVPAAAWSVLTLAPLGVFAYFSAFAIS
jgi:hypothetical protein